MSDEARPGAAAPWDDPEPAGETAAEALARAGRHGRAAAAEAAAALRALLDALALAAGGRDAGAGGLAPLAQGLDAARAWLDHGAEPDAERLLEAVLDALDEEIARWDARSREDPEARSVVRAFLAVRELLFELGVRRGPGDPEPDGGGGGGPGGLQRVPVEG